MTLLASSALLGAEEIENGFNTPILGTGDTSIHPDAWDTPYNKIIQVACHNCFEPQYGASLIEALDYVKAIELDIWDTSFYLIGSGKSGSWFVRHNPGSYNDNNCSGDGYLEECLYDINGWSDRHPDHFPITLFLDKKQRWSTPKEGRTPNRLYSLLRQAFGSKLYRPRDQAAFNQSRNSTPISWQWPKTWELRGRIIVVINGGQFLLDKLTSFFSYSHSTYNTELDKVDPKKVQANAFSGPYIFDMAEIVSPINMNNSSIFLNARYNNTSIQLSNIVYDGDTYRGRILRLWDVDNEPFCSLRSANLQFAAYYDFKAQECDGFKVLPQRFWPEPSKKFQEE